MPDLQETEFSRSAAENTKSGSDQPKDWTIKGLPAKTVEVTREAAKQNGMKLNAWISKALHEAALEHSHTTRTRSTSVESFAPEANDEIARLRRQNDELVTTLTNMTLMMTKMYADKI